MHTCRDCNHWSEAPPFGSETPADYGECKEIRRGLDITVKAGWSGGYVQKVETDADFGCTLWVQDVEMKDGDH